MIWNATRGAMVIAVILAGACMAQSQTDDMEKCYGVARAEDNDGIGQAEISGGATVDFQGDAWKWVPEGSCLTMALPQQTDGTPRRGSLHPLKRDLP